MTAKKTTPKNEDLLDLVMKVDGPEPLAINVGEAEITLRRSHTGLQFATWRRVEQDHSDAVDKILGSKLKGEEKLKKIESLKQDYLEETLTSLTVDTPEEQITQAVKLIVDLPRDARASVMRRIGVLAGVVDEEGRDIPFKKSSDEETDTDD